MKIPLGLRFFLWYFGHFKVPLIGHLRPKILHLDDQKAVIRLPLNRRSKNHLHSMYFGALSVGADIAGGLHAMYFSNKLQYRTSLVFKSFHAQFIKRPESSVYFVSEMGETVRSMLEESKQKGERINKMIIIKAYIHYPQNPELVADFQLELSLKVV